MPIVVRPVLPEEHAAVGELTSRTYLAEGWASEAYAATLADVATRTSVAQVLVAVHHHDVEDRTIFGAVTVATRGGALAELAAPGEAVIRHLVTAPAARGQGVGQALVEACLDAARSDGCRLVRLSTSPRMEAAQRLYGRLGFLPTPDLDWSPEPGVGLRAYALALVPFCDQCGEALLGGADHGRCARLRRLDPPRWCPHCRRRMVVQVVPSGWSAICVEHGMTASA